MKWDVKLGKTNVDRGVEWVRQWLADYDTSRIEWVHFTPGSKRYYGVYGRIHLATKKRPTFRISCQMPGPFPCYVVTRKPPLYPRADGVFPRAPRGCRRGDHMYDPRTGREWIRVIGRTQVKTPDEGLVWIFAHEAFHYLRVTRQVPGRNTEIEADRFADDRLADYRRDHGYLEREVTLFDMFARALTRSG